MARGKKKESLTPEECLQAALVPESEQPYQVPTNWCWTRIGDILRLQAGKNISASKISKSRSQEASFPCFGGNGVRGYVERYNYDGEFPIIGRQGALCGNVNWASGKFYATEHAVVVECSSNISKRWAYHILFSMNLNQYATATAQPGLSVAVINQVPIALPPAPEQQRIVERIESLFSKLDEAKQKAQDALDSFETRKAAILHKAFTGELTAHWRKDHGVGMESWKKSRFDEVATIKSNLVNPLDFPDLPHIAPDNIEKKTGVLLEYHTVSEDGVTSGKHRFYPGQILYSKIRPYLSKVVVVDFDGLCSADMYPIEAEGNVKCLWYYMLSEEFLEQASSAGSRSVLPKINQKELSALTVVLPTLKDEQEEIIRILDDMFAKEQQAKESTERVLEQIDLIKKAILARAFRGELGTNDPSEESAVELLKQALKEDKREVFRV